jgi:hypothetical protein
MSDDCYPWEMEQTIYEVSWTINMDGGWLDRSLLVSCTDTEYALDRVWNYCQNTGTGPRRKEDLKVTERKMLL